MCNILHMAAIISRPPARQLWILRLCIRSSCVTDTTIYQQLARTASVRYRVGFPPELKIVPVERHTSRGADQWTSTASTTNEEQSIAARQRREYCESITGAIHLPQPRRQQ